MKSIETYKNTDSARETQRLLRESGIDSRLVVDPLESRYPALSLYQDVVLMVPDDRVQEATSILRKAMKTAC